MSDQAEGARAASPVAICSAQNAGNLATSVDHAASATGVGDGELILLNFNGTAVCFATTRWRLYRRVCYWQPGEIEILVWTDRQTNTQTDK